MWLVLGAYCLTSGLIQLLEANPSNPCYRYKVCLVLVANLQFAPEPKHLGSDVPDLLRHRGGQGIAEP